MDRYPYFIYPAICELQRNPDKATVVRLREFIAANVGNREALLLLLGNVEESLVNFYPSESKSASAGRAIDSFISNFGAGESPRMDAPVIRQTAEETPDRDDAAEQKEVEADEEDPFPGTPAADNPKEAMQKVKFLVKNRDYDGALEIMEAFYLNNPKKSVYFADQIRFLRKLKLNESKKQL